LGGIAILSGIMYFSMQQQENITLTKSEETKEATFAAGCFWCMEAIMQETEGIFEVISGYTGGEEKDPTYEDVYKGRTGHREAVRVIYDPKQISYKEILDIFWKNIDPTDAGGQFVDRGFSYTTAIFYHNEKQREIAEASKKALEGSERFDKSIATEVVPLTTFYKAEEYHQDFYRKSSNRYNRYKENSGREAYKESVWQDQKREQSYEE